MSWQVYCERLFRRVQLMIGRGRVSQSDDGGNVQLLQVVFGPLEAHDNVPRVSEYGFASRPPDGSDVIVAFIGGDRSNGVVVATNHQLSRLKELGKGESALFDDQGQFIWIKRGGIVVEAAGKPVVVQNASTVSVTASGEIDLTAPTVKVTGNLHVTGTTVSDGEVSHGSHTLSSHTHSNVQNGPGNTGGPTG